MVINIVYFTLKPKNYMIAFNEVNKIGTKNSDLFCSSKNKFPKPFGPISVSGQHVTPATSYFQHALTLSA